MKSKIVKKQSCLVMFFLTVLLLNGWYFASSALCAGIYLDAFKPELLAYWAFNESYGTTAYDSSGNNNQGTITLATRVAGKSGNALLFGADNAHVRLWQPLFLNNGLITIEAWIKPYMMDAGQVYRIVGDYDYMELYFQIRDGRLEVLANGQSYHYGSTQIPIDTWTHIAFTSDGNTVSTYINKVLDKATAITLPTWYIPNTSIGASEVYTGGNPIIDYFEEFPGIIDELKVWTYDLSSPVISGTPHSFTLANRFFKFTPTATDPNGDVLTFCITGKPKWANFNSATGELCGTPSSADIGDYGPITITVKDPDGNTDSLAPFVLKVVKTPVLTGVHLLLKQ